MKQDGRTTPRVPYAEEYRNRKGLSETIQDHSTRIKNVELRANQTPLPGESIVEVRVNGVPIGVEGILDFIEGANVTLTGADDGTAILITIDSTGGGSGYDTVQDEGVDLPQQTIIDFEGAGVTAVDDPLNGRTVVTIPGTTVSGGGLLGWDYIVSPNYPGSDGDTLTDAAGATALVFTTLQAMVDEWVANADEPKACFIDNPGDGVVLAGATIGTPLYDDTVSLLIQGIPGNDNEFDASYHNYRTTLDACTITAAAFIEFRDVAINHSGIVRAITYTPDADARGLRFRRCQIDGFEADLTSAGVDLLEFIDDCKFVGSTSAANNRGIIVASSDGFGITRMKVTDCGFNANARVYLDSRGGGVPVLRVERCDFLGSRGTHPCVETPTGSDSVIALISGLFLKVTTFAAKGVWADASYFGPFSPPDAAVEDLAS